jgi:aspartate/glutamate racemase
MKRVGIIGGLGPDTTSEFYLDLVLSCHKKNKTHRLISIVTLTSVNNMLVFHKLP